MDDINEKELLDGIIAWTEIRSHTFNVPGVNQMITKASEDCQHLGMAVERRTGLEYGDVLTARLPDASGSGEGGILVLGHIDTVHCVESIGREVPVVVEDDKVYGPGIYDMKGGMRAALYGLETVLRRGRPRLPVSFMFIPDEEIGSPTTRELIETEARRQKYVLVPEPTHDRKLVSGRHAFLRFTLTTRGRPAHAGVNNRDGKSAILTMAELIQKLERLSDYERGETYSVGVVHGGLFVNVIPTVCTAQVLAVAPTKEGFGRIQRAMASLGSEYEAGVVEVIPGPVRPLFEAGEGTLMLFDRAAQAASEVGLQLQHAQFGGGSDGNFTGALGIPTLDGLGVDGAALHTAGEYMLRTTLAQRCHVLSRLIETLD